MILLASASDFGRMLSSPVQTHSSFQTPSASNTSSTQPSDATGCTLGGVSCFVYLGAGLGALVVIVVLLVIVVIVLVHTSSKIRKKTKGEREYILLLCRSCSLESNLTTTVLNWSIANTSMFASTFRRKYCCWFKGCQVLRINWVSTLLSQTDPKCVRQIIPILVSTALRVQSTPTSIVGATSESVNTVSSPDTRSGPDSKCLQYALPYLQMHLAAYWVEFLVLCT